MKIICDYCGGKLNIPDDKIAGRKVRLRCPKCGEQILVVGAPTQLVERVNCGQATGGKKFLHTADWQIGMKAQSVGDAGPRVREERLAAGKRVVDVARRHGAEFIVVAGDTFEDNAVDRILVQKVADILGAFDGPVFIIPGNHDPLTPGSVWEHPVWRSWANIRVLREAAPVELVGAVLFPCPAMEKHSGADPIAWIPPDDKTVIRIGLAHGTVEGVRQDEPDYPIPRDAAARAGLNYLALGHWHSYAVYPGAGNAPAMAYSGTHETTKFGERDSGNALIVEITGPGAPPTITPIRTGGLVWMSLDREVRERGDLEQVRADLEAIGNPDTTLIDIRLGGLLMAEERTEVGRIREILEARFLAGRLDDSRLLPSPADDSWLLSLPPGIIQATANRLREIAGTPGEQSQTAGRALLELYAIAGEVGR